MGGNDANGPPKKIGMDVLRGPSSRPGMAPPSTTSVPPSSVSGRYATIASTQPETPGARRSSFTRHSNKALRVVLVAADGEVRANFARVLEKHGGEVHLASSFGEAYHIVESMHSGRTLLLLDPLLPGYEPRLVSMMRQHPNIAGGPIVLASAISAPVLEDAMRVGGADGFIVSSKGLLHLDTALQGWLERFDMALAAG
jgi:PleD family two-component response regulator